MENPSPVTSPTPDGDYSSDRNAEFESLSKELAEKELGQTAMGKNRALPLDARPGANMPPAMHALGLEGHKVASAFAAIAATGDREKTLAALPTLSGSCVGCHYSYRIR